MGWIDDHHRCSVPLIPNEYAGGAPWRIRPHQLTPWGSLVVEVNRRCPDLSPDGPRCYIRGPMLWTLSLSLVLVCCAFSHSYGRDYVGVKRCRSCHESAYQQWLTTPHARAHHRLSPVESRDPRCVSCHSTAASRGLEGVQCESCHGPGRGYWPAAIMGDAKQAQAAGLLAGDDPKVCRNCHTATGPRLKAFDYASAILKVRHRAPVRKTQ